MDHHLKKTLILAIIFIIGFISKPCMAHEIDVDLIGFSYHFDKTGADREAPLKLDSSALWVFNPGIGFAYDFRKDIHTGGPSAIMAGGFFENCANYPFYYLGAGGRYRKFIYKKLFMEANLLAILTEGNDWDDKTYRLNVMPFANLGLGYDFGKFLTEVQISYIPRGIGGEITDGTDMLFMNLSVSF